MYHFFVRYKKSGVEHSPFKLFGLVVGLHLLKSKALLVYKNCNTFPQSVKMNSITKCPERFLEKISKLSTSPKEVGVFVTPLLPLNRGIRRGQLS